MEHELEDARALEAALAFLDDWTAVNATSESNSDCCSSSCASPSSFASLESEISPEEQPTPKPKRRSTADRRKDEIRQLRAEFKELEEKAELMRLTKEWKRRARSCAVGMSGRLALGLAAREKLHAAWKEVATRQKRLRTASEAENAQLRTKVAEHRKMVAAIKAVLRRHAKGVEPILQASPVYSQSLTGGNPDDNRILDELCRQMESSYYAKTNGDLTIVCNGLQLLPGKQIVEVSPTKIIAMVHYTWVLPFDFCQVSSVASDTVDECCRPPYKITEQIVTTNDTQFRSYTMKHTFGGFNYSLCANSALRQRYTPGHAAFVFTGVSQPFVINGASASGISLSNHGVTSFTRIPGSLDGTFLCQIDIATQVEIKVSANAGADRKSQARGLAEAIVDSDREQFDDFIGRIEAAVIQRQMTTSCY